MYEEIAEQAKKAKLAKDGTTTIGKSDIGDEAESTEPESDLTFSLESTTPESIFSRTWAGVAAAIGAEANSYVAESPRKGQMDARAMIF